MPTQEIPWAPPYPGLFGIREAEEAVYDYAEKHQEPNTPHKLSAKMTKFIERMTSTPCDRCGEIPWCWSSRVETEDSYFCSRECADA